MQQIFLFNTDFHRRYSYWILKQIHTNITMKKHNVLYYFIENSFLQVDLTLLLKVNEIYKLLSKQKTEVEIDAQRIK